MRIGSLESTNQISFKDKNDFDYQFLLKINSDFKVFQYSKGPI